jgi:hypothetical protein
MDDDDLVLLRKPGSEAEYLAVVSALEAADIPSLAKNAGVQSLFGAGAIGTGFNLLTGPIQIWVHREDLDEARQVLEGLEIPPDLEEVPGAGDGEGPHDPPDRGE